MWNSGNSSKGHCPSLTKRRISGVHSTLLSPLSDHGCSPTLKNYEGSEIVLSLKANKLAATVSWMLAEDTGLLCQRPVWYSQW